MSSFMKILLVMICIILNQHITAMGQGETQESTMQSKVYAFNEELKELGLRLPPSQLLRDLLQSEGDLALFNYLTEFKELITYDENRKAIKKIALSPHPYHTRAQVIFGFVSELKFRLKDAEKFYQMAIEQGSPEAPSYLAYLYTGTGRDNIIEYNPKKAFDLYTLSAKRGYVGGWIGINGFYMQDDFYPLDWVPGISSHHEQQQRGPNWLALKYCSERIIEAAQKGDMIAKDFHEGALYTLGRYYKIFEKNLIQTQFYAEELKKMHKAYHDVL